jgi:hypothetical protein
MIPRSSERPRTAESLRAIDQVKTPCTTRRATLARTQPTGQDPASRDVLAQCGLPLLRRRDPFGRRGHRPADDRKGDHGMTPDGDAGRAQSRGRSDDGLVGLAAEFVRYPVAIPAPLRRGAALLLS